ncbi:MAG: TonB family protein [Acidobacteriota bacterium]
MYFDFEDRFEDYQPVGGSLRRWDFVLVSLAVHGLVFVVALFVPALSLFTLLPDPRVEAEEPAPPRPDPPRFVFVQPQLDMQALRAPEQADASDKDRTARSLVRPPEATNPMPFSRGNSAERVEAAPEERAAGRGPAAMPSLEPPAPEIVERVPPPVSQRRAETSAPDLRPTPPPGGSLGEALRNLQKYVDQETFHNDQGQVQNLGPLQFDTKGVEFGPWIRRFIAQVRRNWFIPYAAMSLRGRVVLTFNVHKNGALTDVQVVQPSPIESFNIAAMNAMIASNPTEPLPPEYPADRAFFTVTFYYNESP